MEPTPPVEVDPGQLQQVLWNLLRNAAEATSGTGRVQLRVRRVESASGPVVELRVTDDGPGIAPERMDRIFDPFFTTKERGTGFGLAIVHRVVQDNSGTIELSSSPGKGASFRLRFPVATNSPETVAPPQTEAEAPPRPGASSTRLTAASS
ncbi:MAG: ATP-binding protein [Nannocystaceae bacterium]